MKKRLTMMLACLFLSIGMVLAQTHVTGVVISAEDNEPVIGASVKVKGTANAGAVTNMDGEFTLNVKVGTEITVSYIGMEPKTVKATQNMRIVLNADNTTLGEVVVTGYGSARKLGTIAGSVETVSSEKLANRPVANIGDALQGQVAGMQVFTSSGEPSATTSMRIRGVNSIYASSEPLYILDGSQISSSTYLSLNPNDVENVTVLKDASATAIYGSLAANGVIIITSKKGKRGEAPTISLNAQYGFSQLAYDGTTMMNANQWIELQGKLNPDLVGTPSYEAQKAYYKKYGISTNWKDIFFGDNKSTYQIDASVRGGSQNVSYLLSYGHYKMQGIMDDSNMQRETLRGNVDVTITPWLKAGSNTNLAFTKMGTASFGSTGNSVYNKAYASRIYLPTQSYYEVKGLNTNDYANSTFEGYGDRLIYLDQMGYYNPYWLSEVQPTSTDRLRLNENVYINVNPIKGLNFKSALGLDANDYRSHYKCLNTVDIAPNVFPTGSVSESTSRFERWTLTNTAEYKFNINNQHDVTVLLGHEFMDSHSSAFGVMVEGLEDNRMLYLSAAAQTGVNIPSQSTSDERRLSWFGMLNYGFADRYYVDLSVRRDGSSLFAKGHEWGTFGAGAFMWNITNERFMRNTKKWLQNLTFKVSYGVTGNANISAYQQYGLVSAGGNYNGQSGITIASAENPNLSWEKVYQLNTGISAHFLNRFTLDLEVYNKETKDMLMQMPKSWTTGFSAGYANVGAMRNTGVDITLGADIIKNKDWYWNVRVNANYNHNEITKLFNGVNSFDVTDLVHLEKGHAYGELYAVRWSHVDPRDGMNVWLDKNGNETKVYDESDKVLTGYNTVAPWSAGLSTTVSWKGITLDVQFAGMFDRYMLNNDRYFIENPTFASSANQSTEMMKIWQKPGDVTKIASVNSERHFDTSLLENASFVRLKFLQLSYNLPQNWLDATHFIKGAKVFFTTRNLLTFTSYTGYDPEVDGFSTIGDYPNTRQFSFGAQLTF